MKMSRGPTQGDISKAQKATKAAGLVAVRTEIDIANNRVTVYHLAEGNTATAEVALAEFQARRAARNARSS